MVARTRLSRDGDEGGGVSAWVKVMNSLRSHPKVVGISDRAFRVYVCSLLYANEHETDGRLDKRILGALLPGKNKSSAAFRELFEQGLWEDCGDFCEIHDYLSYQSSSAQIRERRAATGDRVRKHRKRNTDVTGNAAVAVTPPRVRETEEEEERTTANAVVTSPVDPEIERLCRLHSQLVRERTETPSSSTQYRPTESWRTEMRRLIERDGRKPEEIEAAIRWVHTHRFWSKNILSVPKLREQYGRLVVEAKNGSKPKDDGRLERNRRRLGLDQQGAA